MVPWLSLRSVAASLVKSHIVVPHFGQLRHFGHYEGRSIADEELIKKSDDWVNGLSKQNLLSVCWFLVF